MLLLSKGVCRAPLVMRGCFVAAVSLFVAIAGSALAASAPWKKLRSDGDKAFRSGEYDAAASAYTQAISSAKSSGEKADGFKRLYLQRAKANHKRGSIGDAVSDLGHALASDSAFIAARLMRALLNVERGHCADARKEYEEILTIDPRKRDAQKKLPEARACEDAIIGADQASARGDWSAVERHVGEAILPGRATKAPRVLLRRAEARMHLQKFAEASADSLAAIKMDRTFVDAYHVRGKTFYAQEEWESAFQHFQQALKLDPENVFAKGSYARVKRVRSLDEGAREARGRGDHALAAEKLQQLEHVDPGHGPLRLRAAAELAECYVQMKDGKRAVEAATRALAIHDKHEDALLSLMEGHLLLDEFEAASRAAQRAVQASPRSGRARQAAQKAEQLLKRSKEIDYYKVLGVSRSSTDREIKKAYHKLALAWHPDKAPSEEAREEFDTKFKEMNAAYEVLSDPEKKAKYDRGEDPDKPQGGPGGPGGPFGGFPGGFRQGGSTFSFRFG